MASRNEKPNGESRHTRGRRGATRASTGSTAFHTARYFSGDAAAPISSAAAMVSKENARTPDPAVARLRFGEATTHLSRYRRSGGGA